MTDKTDLPFEDWLSTQQQYFNTWSQMMQQTMQTVNAVNTKDNAFSDLPWTQGIEWYKKMFTSAMPDELQTVFDKLMEQSQAYMQFNTQFIEAWQKLAQVDHKAENWQHLWNDAFKELRQSFTQVAQGQHANLNFFELPLDNWWRAASTLSGLPGDFFQNMKQTPTHHFDEHINRLLSMPSVGYTREWQEQLQEGARLWRNYQQEQQEYISLFGKVGLRALDLMRDKLLMAEQPIETLRGVYDLWVDCGEVAYAELVTTEEYSKLNARLVNAMMAWKQHEQNMIDDVLGTLNMPTRKELDSINLRMQQMRRDIKALQATENGMLVSELQHELTALRAELEALKAKKTTRKTTTRRKSTTTKAAESKTTTTAAQQKKTTATKTTASKSEPNKTELKPKDDNQ